MYFYTEIKKELLNTETETYIGAHTYTTTSMHLRIYMTSEIVQN